MNGDRLSPPLRVTVERAKIVKETPMHQAVATLR